MWGSIIGAGLSLYGSMQAKKGARGQERMSMEELKFKREQAEIDNLYRERAYQRSEQGFEREDEMFDYMMGYNKKNELAAQEYMNYSRDLVQKDQNYRQQEQDYERYRIGKADTLAAAERARELEQFARDESTNAQERQLALDELEYVRQIAAGERDYDVKRFEEDQMRSELEYQKRVNDYETQMGMADKERQLEIDRQTKILGQANTLSREIEDTVYSFGDLERVKRYGEDDVDQFANEFYTGYLEDADRAADRLSSVNEADLIRRGVDDSTTGDSSRRRLLQEQLTPLYNNARIQARQDGMGYVNNLQNNEINAFNADVSSRAAAIEEKIRGKEGLLQVMQNMNNPVSAQTNGWANLGSASNNGSIRTSAGDFRAPLNINSGVAGRQTFTPGMSNSMRLSNSMAGGQISSANGSFNPTQPTFSTGGSLLSSASGGSGYADNFASLAAGAGQASSDSTRLLMDAGSQFGSWMDTRSQPSTTPYGRFGGSTGPSRRGGYW